MQHWGGLLLGQSRVCRGQGPGALIVAEKQQGASLGQASGTSQLVGQLRPEYCGCLGRGSQEESVGSSDRVIAASVLLQSRDPMSKCGGA